MIAERWWLYLGAAGFLGYIPALPPELRLLNLFFLMPLVQAMWRWLTVGADEPSRKRPDLPLPPPAGGSLRMTGRLLIAQPGMLVIPSMLRQVLRQNRGDAAASARVVDEAAAYRQKTRYRLPFDGQWFVYNGGVTRQTSHSWDIAGQRYAYDFVVVDDALRRWRTDGRDVADYLCYDLPVLAPAAGEVVAVVDDVRDAPHVGTGWLDLKTPHFPGNAVTIRHAEGEYSFLAHLRPGTIAVRAGDRVERGQEIGRCGNSGHSTEPHLHFQLQDRADFFEAAGLPVAFDFVAVDGNAVTSDLHLTQGMRVEHVPDEATR